MQVSLTSKDFKTHRGETYNLETQPGSIETEQAHLQLKLCMRHTCSKLMDTKPPREVGHGPPCGPHGPSEVLALHIARDTPWARVGDHTTCSLYHLFRGNLKAVMLRMLLAAPAQQTYSKTLCTFEVGVAFESPPSFPVVIPIRCFQSGSQLGPRHLAQVESADPCRVGEEDAGFGRFVPPSPHPKSLGKDLSCKPPHSHKTHSISPRKPLL